MPSAAPSNTTRMFTQGGPRTMRNSGQYTQLNSGRALNTNIFNSNAYEKKAQIHITQDENMHTNSAESKPNPFSGYATHRISALQATELQSGNSNNEAKQLPSKFNRPMKIRNINSNQARDLGSARVVKPAKKAPSR